MTKTGESEFVRIYSCFYNESIIFNPKCSVGSYVRTLFWIKSTMKVLPLCFSVWLKCIVKGVGFWREEKRERQGEGEEAEIQILSPSLTGVCDCGVLPNPLKSQGLCPSKAEECTGRIK